MFKLTIRIKARCPRHTRYNPEKQGMAFRAGCDGCARVWQIYQRAMALRGLIGEADKEKGVMPNDSTGPKTVRDLMYQMAERAKVLANQSLPELRYTCGTADTWNGAQRENRHLSRGQLLEDILIEEFEGAANQLEEAL